MIPKKNKEWKRKKLEELSALRNDHKYFIFFNFSGLDVPSFIDLRKKMKELGNQVKVAKAAFIRMLFGITFKEPIAVLAVKEDPIKAVKEFTKVLGDERIRGAFLEGKFFDAKSTISLKDSPDASQLRGMIVGSLASILSRVLLSLSWNQISLIHILRQKAEAERESRERGG